MEVFLPQSRQVRVLQDLGARFARPAIAGKKSCGFVNWRPLRLALAEPSWAYGMSINCLRPPRAPGPSSTKAFSDTTRFPHAKYAMDLPKRRRRRAKFSSWNVHHLVLSSERGVGISMDQLGTLSPWMIQRASIYPDVAKSQSPANSYGVCNDRRHLGKWNTSTQRVEL